MRCYKSKYICVIVFSLFVWNHSTAQSYKAIESASKVLDISDSLRAIGIKAFDDFILESRQSEGHSKSGSLLLNQPYIVEKKTKSFLVVNNNYNDVIEMGGTLDGFNTYSRLSKNNRLENNYSQFIPMESISITNNGNERIIAPRLLINSDKNWYNTGAFFSEFIGEKGGDLDKDRILHLWNFLKNNREHYSPSGYDGMNTYKMFAVYGYSTCDIVAYVCRLLASYGGNNGYSYLMPHHTVAEVSDGVKHSLVDADLEVFYLNSDNQSLAGVDEVIADKYLITRTKHFGKNLLYDKETDAWIANVYSLGRFAPEKSPDANNLRYPISSFDFVLKPSETINFRYEKAEKYYHNWLGNGNIPDSFLEFFISNSQHILATKLDSSSFNSIFEESKNIRFSQAYMDKPALYASVDSAYLIYRVNLPFPILDARLKGLFHNTSDKDSISVFLSLDNEISWDKIWFSHNVGTYEDSIHIGNYFPYPLPDRAVYPPYSYSLKITLNPFDSLSICGLDSLYIENTFQISKRFLPTLKLGSNPISYQDQNIEDSTRNVHIAINWKENSENNPPNKIGFPIFPLNQSEIDSLYFAFTWDIATDNDGDMIADYEFMLADHPEMNYPLSPNFNQYGSALGESTIRPYFKVKETGWLNEGKTYYWKVRAKDSRGAWGEWSDIWSFVPHGVMRPQNGNTSIWNDSLQISWQSNKTGQKPDFYKIYASNESNGFTPNQKTFFTTTLDTIITILCSVDNIPKTFYRITACQNNGQESAPSDVIAIPFPTVFLSSDIVSSGQKFQLKIATNETYYPYYYYGNDTTFNKPEIIPVSYPDWLQWNGSEFTGMSDSTDADSLARKLVYMDSLQRTVVFSLVDTRGGASQQKITLQTTETNNKPVLMLSDSVVCERSLFEAYVTSTDGDVAFGDINNYTILQKPIWLDYDIKGDTIYLSGILDEYPVTGLIREESILRILAVDTKNDSATVDFLFYIIPQVPIVEKGNLLCQIIRSSSTEYHVKIQSAKEAGFKYNIYSINGMLLFSSSNHHLAEGTYYLPIDMSKYSSGMYIFVGYEDNKIRHSIKFIKL